MLRGTAILAIVPLFLLSFCERTQPEAAPQHPPFDAAYLRLSPAEVAALPLAVRFEAPMGSEQAGLTYNAQPFRVTRHLGDDLNGVGGWNSDLGDPVYAAATGKVIYAGWPSDGWGNMVVLMHRVPDASAPDGWRVHQAVYAHLDKIQVKHGDIVPRGAQLGSVGTAGGKYLAHLHFEIREGRSIYPGPGYSDFPLDRVSPASFQKVRGKTGDTVVLKAPERVAR
jgi:murein DD-endopeptidase MepM/ murein hydrolase activator NlpD